MSKKPKLYADEQLPESIRLYIDENGFSIPRTALKGHPDENICRKAKKENRIVVTMNTKHFWEEKYCPLRHTGGIIILDFSTDQVEQAKNAFCILWNNFVKEYSSKLLTWEGLKAKISASQLTLKWISTKGKEYCEKYKIENGTILMTTRNPKCENLECTEIDNCRYYD